MVLSHDDEAEHAGTRRDPMQTFNPTAANDAGSAPPKNQAPDAGLEPDRVAQLEAERADFKEKLLRTLADMENLRRRTEREIADARTYAVSNFARDMLTVADNFQRAIDSVPAGGARGGGRARAQGADRGRRVDRARHAQDA